MESSITEISLEMSVRVIPDSIGRAIDFDGLVSCLLNGTKICPCPLVKSNVRFKNTGKKRRADLQILSAACEKARLNVPPAGNSPGSGQDEVYMVLAGLAD